MSSNLGDIPPELMSMVLRRLVGPDCPMPNPEVDYDARSWATLTRNKPKFDPAILRASKGFQAIAKLSLDRDNNWITFDVDNAYLLFPWLGVLVPHIMVDLEDNVAALPQGIMRVRVKMFVSGMPFIENMKNTYPPSMPRRQIFLVQSAYFEAFLQAIRQMEFTYGVRVMPGQQFECQERDDTGNPVLVTAAKGTHGLTLRVVVSSPTFPRVRMNKFLEQFRMFHGPLNEVSIIGYAEPARARSIEASITAARDTTTQLTWHEFTIMIAQRTKTAADLIVHNRYGWTLAHILHHQLQDAMYNIMTFDETPWTGSPENDWHTRRFETLMLAIPHLNAAYANIQTRQKERFLNANNAIAMHPSSECEAIASFPDLAPEFLGWIMLLSGLHLIFSTIFKVDEDDETQNERMIATRHGMVLIEGFTGNVIRGGYMAPEDTEMFEMASDMCKRLREKDLDLTADNTEFFESLDEYRGDFIEHLVDFKRPLKWAIHESLIPDQLVARGVLEHMTDCSTEDLEEKFLVVRTFKVEVDDEEEEGISYCV